MKTVLWLILVALASASGLEHEESDSKRADHFVVVTTFAFYFDGQRSETLDAFEVFVSERRDAVYELQVCAKAPYERLEMALDFFYDKMLVETLRLSALAIDDVACTEAR